MNFCNYSRELFSYGIYNATTIDMACIEIKKRHTCTVIEILQNRLKKLAIKSFSKSKVISELLKISTEWYRQIEEMKDVAHDLTRMSRAI